MWKIGVGGRSVDSASRQWIVSSSSQRGVAQRMTIITGVRRFSDWRTSIIELVCPAQALNESGPLEVYGHWEKAR